MLVCNVHLCAWYVPGAVSGYLKPSFEAYVLMCHGFTLYSELPLLKLRFHNMFRACGKEPPFPTCGCQWHEVVLTWGAHTCIYQFFWCLRLRQECKFWDQLCLSSSLSRSFSLPRWDALTHDMWKGTGVDELKLCCQQVATVCYIWPNYEKF